MSWTLDAALDAFHTRFAGASAQVFGRGRLEDGRSSYACVADAIPPEAEDVLDLACGDGALLALLEGPGRRCVGVDPSAAERAAAHRRLGGRVRLLDGRAQALPLPNASFDAITCHMAFMLFDEAEQVVAELRRVLRPGGALSLLIGQSPPATPLVTAWFTALREARAADGLRVAWAPYRGKEADMMALFADWAPLWRPRRLTLQIPRPEVWLTLRLCYYEAGLLGPAASAALAARLEAILDDHGVGDVLAWPVDVAHLTGRRPAEPAQT